MASLKISTFGETRLAWLRELAEDMPDYCGMIANDGKVDYFHFDLRVFAAVHESLCLAIREYACKSSGWELPLNFAQSADLSGYDWDFSDDLRDFFVDFSRDLDKVFVFLEFEIPQDPPAAKIDGLIRLEYEPAQFDDIIKTPEICEGWEFGYLKWLEIWYNEGDCRDKIVYDILKNTL